MFESPAARTPYEVLGVSATASQDELRRAYRKQARQTHPDTGGDAAKFQAVQSAWERVGTSEARDAYERGRRRHTAEPAHETFAPQAPRARRPEERSRPRARSYGHPGGVARVQFLALIREWAGRGVTVEDPYDPTLVRSAPRDVRHWLAKALAQEATVKQVSALGIGYTIWSDVATGRDPQSQSGKIDHVVLGPAGLFAVLSEDWGSPVKVVRGEITGDAIRPGDEPVRSVTRGAKTLGRTLGVRFTARVVVVPDDDLAEPMITVKRGRNANAVVVRRSLLPQLLRDGTGDGPRTSVDEIFEVRSRLQNGIVLV